MRVDTSESCWTHFEDHKTYGSRRWAVTSISAALRAHHGQISDVAETLVISRLGLHLKRQRLGF